MSQEASRHRISAIAQQFTLWLFAGAMTLSFTILLSIDFLGNRAIEVTEGEPALQEVVAPRTIAYDSVILTEQAREQASTSVGDIYTGEEFSVLRTQINEVGTIFTFIDVVRADTLADTSAKTSYLQAIEGVEISDEVAEALLGLSPAGYTATREDITRILDELLREEVRDDPQAIANTKARIPNEINVRLTLEQELIVTSLTPQFIVANSFFDQAATELSREEKASEVEDVRIELFQGDRIVGLGEEVTALHLEMLGELGLLQREISWQAIVASLLISFLGMGLLTIYWQKFHEHKYASARYLIILGALLVVFGVGAKIIAPSQNNIAYLFPTAALTMLVAVIFDVRLSVFVTAILAMLIGYITQSLELTLYNAIGPLFAILTLRDAQRVNAFYRAGLVASLANIALILVFRLTTEPEFSELLELGLFSVLNGLLFSSGLTLGGFFIIGGLFGIMTVSQLQELSRLDHPLLQELLRKAPGTYHHSIMVANLAEQAAERIGAQSSLVRVGAFYHDIGKMNRPPFFTENQESGVNPLMTLDPFTSARIIINHVSDGLDLANKHRLPLRIQDFIAEHHGTRMVKMFYYKAVEQKGGNEELVDKNRFCHRGPAPRSRETAIVAMADSIEAASTALRPNTEEGIEKLVNKIVDDHLQEKQLDESGLTLGDIKMIRESFMETLHGRFHVRVRYPGNEELEVSEPAEAQITVSQDVPSIAPQPIGNEA